METLLNSQIITLLQFISIEVDENLVVPETWDGEWVMMHGEDWLKLQNVL